MENNGSLGRLKHLWEVEVAQVQTVGEYESGGSHTINVAGYWDPEHELTDESVRLAGLFQAMRNAGVQVKQLGAITAVRSAFAVINVKLIA